MSRPVRVRNELPGDVYRARRSRRALTGTDWAHMRLGLIRWYGMARGVGVGTVGAVIFLFVFPKGAISTLVHAVLHLPGPGAGIAVVVGPFLVLLGLSVSLFVKTTGAATITSLSFAIAHVLIARLLAIPTDPKGAFASPVFVAAAVVCGVFVETGMLVAGAIETCVKTRHPGISLRGLWAWPGVLTMRTWSCMVSGALANAALLVFYWVAVFPWSYKPVACRDVPVLMGLALFSGGAGGYVAWAGWRAACRAFGLR